MGDFLVDVIIPVYKPGEEFIKLIGLLEKQSCHINRIIVMNTEEKYFAKLQYEKKWVNIPENVEVHHISRREFDHGNTRNAAVKRSKADFFVCMTQDAVPADDLLIERLIKPLVQKKAQISYARQLPKDDTGPIESYTRSFNYPDKSMLKSSADLDTLGIKTFFCSNVCAAYQRSYFDKLGGFTKKTIFNEDMIIAAALIRSGGKVAYVADAKVYHAHNYDYKEYFHRNFDMGVSQAEHPEVFADIKSEGEGISLVRMTARHLLSNGKGKLVPLLLWNSGWKYLGYILGKNFSLLPMSLVRRFSMNKHYWIG